MKPNLGDLIADKYRLERALGAGGMGTVYAAINLLTGKQVAIKWLLPQLADHEHAQRLLREARATGAIDHPNVVNVYDVVQHRGALFLVMELLHGEPLSRVLARGVRDACEFVKLMMPVLRGVHAAHRQGVVHRDLKPDNIFVCRGPEGEAREAKVLDFGLSKLIGQRFQVASTLTRAGAVCGTPQYMAPEQLRDARGVDQRSDVYALGVIFYRALSARFPYAADTLAGLALRICEGDAPHLHALCPQLERGLCDLIMRALARDPAHRFENAAAFGQALEPYAGGVPFALAPQRDSEASLDSESGAWERARAGREERLAQAPLSAKPARLARRRGLSLAAALVVVGSLAPAGFRRWTDGARAAGGVAHTVAVSRVDQGVRALAPAIQTQSSAARHPAPALDLARAKASGAPSTRPVPAEQPSAGVRVSRAKAAPIALARLASARLTSAGRTRRRTRPANPPAHEANAHASASVPDGHASQEKASAGPRAIRADAPLRATHKVSSSPRNNRRRGLRAGAAQPPAGAMHEANSPGAEPQLRTPHALGAARAANPRAPVEIGRETSSGATERNPYLRR